MTDRKAKDLEVTAVDLTPAGFDRHLPWGTYDSVIFPIRIHRGIAYGELGHRAYAPGPGMLEEFASLAAASTTDDAIFSYAKKWGVLEINAKGQSRTYTERFRPRSLPVRMLSKVGVPEFVPAFWNDAPYPSSKMGWAWEPFGVWRRWAAIARSTILVANAL